MNIGEKIRYLREVNNVSQEKLSKLLNVAQQTVSQYETNRRNVPLEAFEILAKYFNVSIDYLFGYNGDTSNENILMIKVDDPIIREKIEDYAQYVIDKNKKEKKKIERDSK